VVLGGDKWRCLAGCIGVKAAGDTTVGSKWFASWQCDDV
jgi:hypothetical protein